MPENQDFCKQHSGFNARITHIENEKNEQWTKMEHMETKMDSIFTRLNIILGGVVVACIMLLINIVIKGFK